jgi:hypothetical protein
MTKNVNFAVAEKSCDGGSSRVPVHTFCGHAAPPFVNRLKQGHDQLSKVANAEASWGQYGIEEKSKAHITIFRLTISTWSSLQSGQCSRVDWEECHA